MDGNVFSNISAPDIVIEPKLKEKNLKVVAEGLPAMENGCIKNGETEHKEHFISFHNITYTVEQRVCFKKKPPKIILNDVRSVAIS